MPSDDKINELVDQEESSVVDLDIEEPDQEVDADKDAFEADETGSTQHNELDKSKTVEQAIEEGESTASSDAFESDPEIDKAVDDIVRTESDEAIAEADAKIAALSAVKNKQGLKSRIAGWIFAWWNNRPARYGTLLALLVIIVAATMLPTSRYAMLNLFGVRVSSSLVVIDSQTRLPLKNIEVSLQGKSAASDSDGKVAFSGLRLGRSELNITKLGYADNKRTIVLGWGSNPLGEQELVATGEQFIFVLSDWQSNEPITKAEATAGTNSARADDNGKIILTVGENDISELTVVITADGYRSEELGSEELIDGENTVKMVPGKKHVFVSNRNGDYDLYKIDVDGKNEQMLLGATGKEREVPALALHPSRDVVAFVSSRDGETNADGFVLDGLYVIDVLSGETKRIARSEQLQLIGWSGDKLVYWQVVEGTSRANPERSKLISYNERTSERFDLAAANYFNDVKLVGDTVYYAVSSYAVPQSQAKLYRVSTTAQDRVKLLDKQVWGIYRSTHSRLLFNAEDQKWYERVGDGVVEETEHQTAPLNIRFRDSPNGEKTAWVEVRDGKGVLLIASTEQDDEAEQTVLTLPGLDRVHYWVNDTTLVFMVITNSETADYVVDIGKGEAIKITDVSATSNFYF